MKVALDCETGGLEADKNPILGLAIWSPELEESEHGPFVIRMCADGGICHPKALEVNKLDPNVGVTRAVAAQMLFDWWVAQGRPRFELVGHNVGPFDVPFVRQLERAGVDLPWHMMFDYHYRDSATLALACYDLGLLGGKLSLGAVCAQLGIKFAAHDALQDAKASWHAWHRMCHMLQDASLVLTRIKQRQPGLEVYANDGRHWVAPYGWQVIDLGSPSA